MLISLIRDITNRIKTSIPQRIIKNPINYWEKRARQYGKRSVLNVRHSEEEVEYVTEMQKEVIFPFLKKMLIGNEEVILDFGCGTGRFTPDLAKMINGKAIGIDPIRYLIDMAPKIINVEYLLCKEGQIPLPENSVDVVWSCLVLGGINGKSLKKSIEEIDRVLKTGGLLFIVENTSEKKDGEFWFFRQFTDYKKLFSFVVLDHLHDYYDFDERISLMAGRKF